MTKNKNRELNPKPKDTGSDELVDTWMNFINKAGEGLVTGKENFKKMNFSDEDIAVLRTTHKKMKRLYRLLQTVKKLRMEIENEINETSGHHLTTDYLRNAEDICPDICDDYGDILDLGIVGVPSFQKFLEDISCASDCARNEDERS